MDAAVRGAIEGAHNSVHGYIGGTIGSGHSAFEDPNTPPDAPKRESIEVRTMAFF